jgi:hypothetical protein
VLDGLIFGFWHSRQRADIFSLQIFHIPIIRVGLQNPILNIKDVGLSLCKKVRECVDIFKSTTSSLSALANCSWITLSSLHSSAGLQCIIILTQSQRSEAFVQNTNCLMEFRMTCQEKLSQLSDLICTHPLKVKQSSGTLIPLQIQSSSRVLNLSKIKMHLQINFTIQAIASFFW